MTKGRRAMDAAHADGSKSPVKTTVSRRRLIRAGAKLAAAAPLLGSPVIASGAEGAQADTEGALRVDPRVIPTPPTISPEAQRFLAAASARLGPNAPAPAPTPPVSDKAAWKAYIAGYDKMFDAMAERRLAKTRAKVEKTMMGEGVVYVGTPQTLRYPDRARIAIHGGAWTIGGGLSAMADAAEMADQSGCVVFSVDYRMPPDHPYPAALDDCLSAYREVIKTYAPTKVAISGISSGGNLVGAVTLKLRDIGLPLPGAAIILTPVSDLSQLSDTWSTNMGIDPIVTRHTYANNDLYTEGRDIRDPYLSPRLGDFTKGFPPTLLQSGTRDILLSDTVLLHRALVKAGIEAELHVWEAMPHAGFGGDTPEDREVVEQILKFIDKHLA
jgi:monoterpene epsilon-lactone hydrolase